VIKIAFTMNDYSSDKSGGRALDPYHRREEVKMAG
jgi:hypothetical protein